MKELIDSIWNMPKEQLIYGITEIVVGIALAYIIISTVFVLIVRRSFKNKNRHKIF